MIPPGTKITCPNCSKHLATTNSFVQREEDGSLAIQDFDWKAFRVKHDDSIAGHCPFCGENWTDSGGWIHTSHGWEEV
jgi:hypothetical protein